MSENQFANEKGKISLDKNILFFMLMNMKKRTYTNE